MFAAVLILLVMAAVVLLLNPSREDFGWFLRLRRPSWLSFEKWIPLIWICIYACFWGAALLSWRARSNLAQMLAFLGLVLLVQSYTLVICRTRSLATGTWIGFAGWIWGMALAVVLAGEVPLAALLLVPYLLWSPIGTVVTWQMQRLNR